MHSSASYPIRIWRTSNSKHRQLTLVATSTTKEQIQTRPRAQTQRPLAHKPIATSVQPTFCTAILFLLHQTLLPCILLVAKSQGSPGRKLSSCSVKTVVSHARRSATIDQNIQTDGDRCQLLRTRHWHGLTSMKWLCLNQTTWRQKTSNPYNSRCGRWKTIVDLCL